MRVKGKYKTQGHELKSELGGKGMGSEKKMQTLYSFFLTWVVGM